MREPVVGRVDALWAAVRQEVAHEAPELLGDFDANVGRLATAVEFKRAADADKAATNLGVLVDFYLASSAAGPVREPRRVCVCSHRCGGCKHDGGSVVDVSTLRQGAGGRGRSSAAWCCG